MSAKGALPGVQPKPGEFASTPLFPCIWAISKFAQLHCQDVPNQTTARWLHNCHPGPGSIISPEPLKEPLKQTPAAPRPCFSCLFLQAAKEILVKMWSAISSASVQKPEMALSRVKSIILTTARGTLVTSFLHDGISLHSPHPIFCSRCTDDLVLPGNMNTRNAPAWEDFHFLFFLPETLLPGNPH